MTTTTTVTTKSPRRKRGSNRKPYRPAGGEVDGQAVDFGELPPNELPVKAPYSRFKRKGVQGDPSTRKKITRRKPGAKPMNYFDNTTQMAIVNFQQETAYPARNKIYLEEIYPAFDSLVENLINVYGFNVMFESRDDLKNECLEFLYGALPKFNAEKGSKAFSYFNVVAKNWLTIRSKQNVKRLQACISLDNQEAISEHDLTTIEGYRVALDGETILTNRETRGQIVQLIAEIQDKVKTDNEQSCIKAITILLENLEEVDLLNKRAILLYLREITGLSSKTLSIALATLKKHYKELKKRDEYQF